MCAICVANDRKNCDTIVTIEKAAENAKFSPALAELEELILTKDVGNFSFSTIGMRRCFLLILNVL
jgi:hypothetical protein